MFCFAIGEAFRTGVHKAMIFTYLKLNGWQDQKVHYYGHTRSWSQLGSAVSSLVAAMIVFYSGEYQSVFACSTIPYFLDMILIASYPDNLDGQKSPLKWHLLKSKFGQLMQDFYHSFKKPHILKAVNNVSLYSGYYKAVKDYLQPILHTLALSLPFMLALDDQKRSALLIGVVYFFIYLLTSFVTRHAGKLTDYLQQLNGPLNTTLLLGLIIGLLTGGFEFMGLSLLATVFFILLYLVENLRKPIGIGFFADQINEDILASALSAQSQVRTIWAAIIALLLGAMMDKFGLGITLSITSFALLLLVPVFWLAKPLVEKISD